jgi:hypothetical protein
MANPSTQAAGITARICLPAHILLDDFQRLASASSVLPMLSRATRRATCRGGFLSFCQSGFLASNAVQASSSDLGPLTAGVSNDLRKGIRRRNAH